MWLVDTLQMTFENVYYSMINMPFFATDPMGNKSSMLRVSFGAKQVTSHCVKQCWPGRWCVYASLDANSRSKYFDHTYLKSFQVSFVISGLSASTVIIVAVSCIKYQIVQCENTFWTCWLTNYKQIVDSWLYYEPIYSVFTIRFHIGSAKVVRNLSGSTKPWKCLSDDLMQ